MSNRNSRKRRVVLTVIAVICIISLAITLYTLQNKPYNDNAYLNQADFIKFIDVGQGDSALIYSDGYSALIDVGEHENFTAISEVLGDYGITQLDALIISHLHSDHVGALPEIAELYTIDNLFMPTLSDKSIASAKSGKQKAIEDGADFYDSQAGINFKLGEFEITMLSDFEDKSNENNRSTFVMAKIDGTKILFTGDGEAKVENVLLKNNVDIDCDILKVGHHGSNTSSSKAFLKAATPNYAVISVGENNTYYHPHNVTLNALKSCKAKVLRTDKNGDITFDFTNDKIEIRTEK